MAARHIEWTEKFSDNEEIERIAEEIAGPEAITQMEDIFRRGQRFLDEFYAELPHGSLTKRSIERKDSWSETASWARREGHQEFATELDALTWTYNGLVPEELAD